MPTQTPVHDLANLDLLKMIPTNSKLILEVGCSSGALAREYKEINPNCSYRGVEIEESYAELARKYCDEVLLGDIELFDESFWLENSNVNCWIFADVLEHLKDPWRCLGKIHSVLPMGGSVIACIPNIQHWSILVKLSLGNFRYEEMGLLDKTHLRWFTRKTIIELFESTGFKVTELIPRIFDEPQRDNFLGIIQRMASRAGGDASEALKDALPLQYLVKATNQ